MKRSIKDEESNSSKQEISSINWTAYLAQPKIYEAKKDYISMKKVEARPGLEPGMEDLQSSALANLAIEPQEVSFY